MQHIMCRHNGNYASGSLWEWQQPKYTPLSKILSLPSGLCRLSSWLRSFWKKIQWLCLSVPANHWSSHLQLQENGLILLILCAGGMQVLLMCTIKHSVYLKARHTNRTGCLPKSMQHMDKKRSWRCVTGWEKRLLEAWGGQIRTTLCLQTVVPVYIISYSSSLA